MKNQIYGQFVGIVIVLFFIVASLSGCVSNQTANLNVNNDATKFLGTWSGSIVIPMFGNRNNSAMSLTQLTFSQDRVEVTMTSEQGSFPMTYNYTINGNTLVLEPRIFNRGGFPGRQSPNGQWPRNGTRPSNETWPPYNNSRPYNGSRPSNWTQPSDDNRQSMNLSFVYSFNEQDTVLNLNGAEFMKIQ